MVLVRRLAKPAGKGESPPEVDIKAVEMVNAEELLGGCNIYAASLEYIISGKMQYWSLVGGEGVLTTQTRRPHCPHGACLLEHGRDGIF